jgi:hypothetical protein
MLEGRDWYRVEGASARTIEDLRAAATERLPKSYIQLLSVSNGGEGPLPVDPFNLCLDPAEDVISRLAGQSAFDGFLIFGGNGGGEYLALDMRNEGPWPVVTFDMVAGPASAKVVAADFDTFTDLIGVQPPAA